MHAMGTKQIFVVKLHREKWLLYVLHMLTFKKLCVSKISESAFSIFRIKQHMMEKKAVGDNSESRTRTLALMDHW